MAVLNCKDREPTDLDVLVRHRTDWAFGLACMALDCAHGYDPHGLCGSSQPQVDNMYNLLAATLAETVTGGCLVEGRRTAP